MKIKDIFSASFRNHPYFCLHDLAEKAIKIPGQGNGLSYSGSFSSTDSRYMGIEGGNTVENFITIQSTVANSDRYWVSTGDESSSLESCLDNPIWSCGLKEIYYPVEPSNELKICIASWWGDTGKKLRDCDISVLSADVEPDDQKYDSMHYQGDRCLGINFTGVSVPFPTRESILREFTRFEQSNKIEYSKRFYIYRNPIWTFGALKNFPGGIWWKEEGETLDDMLSISRFDPSNKHELLKYEFYEGKDTLLDGIICAYYVPRDKSKILEAESKMIEWWQKCDEEDNQG